MTSFRLVIFAKILFGNESQNRTKIRLDEEIWTKRRADEDKCWNLEDKKLTKSGQGHRFDNMGTISGHTLDKLWTWDKLWAKTGRPTLSTTTEFPVVTNN